MRRTQALDGLNTLQEFLLAMALGDQLSAQRASEISGLDYKRCEALLDALMRAGVMMRLQPDTYVRCRLEPFVKLAKTIKHYQPLILNAVEHGLSNARSEATNTHLRLLTRRAYGYHSPEALIAMADLTRGGLCPPLPGRS